MHSSVLTGACKPEVCQITCKTVSDEIAAYIARNGGHSSWGFWLVPVGVALGCAALAVKYGDDFWRNIFKW